MGKSSESQRSASLSIWEILSFYSKHLPNTGLSNFRLELRLRCLSTYHW
jgi:hypothetical protein